MIDNVVIERAKIKDLKKLMEFYSNMLPIRQDYNKMKEKFKQVRLDNNNIILVAKSDNEVVGTLTGIVCKSIAWGGHDFMVLDYLYVLKEFRKNGIATKLFNTIEEYARTLNCGYIFFTSSTKNVEAHKLYKKLGYSEDVIGFRKVLIRDD